MVKGQALYQCFAFLFASTKFAVNDNCLAALKQNTNHKQKEMCQHIYGIRNVKSILLF